MPHSNDTAREKELLAAADVAELIGVEESTVYRWCSEGKLPCLKTGENWLIRRGVLEDFLEESGRPRTLVGQLDSFLRVPESVLAIAQNIEILHRLDAAFFRVGEARGGPLSGSRWRQLAQLIEEKGGYEGRTVWASFDWVKPLDLETALEQQRQLGELVDARRLVVKTAAIEDAIEEWTASELRRVRSMHSAMILASDEDLLLSHATPMPPS
jgi:excisionase family DNA binding protein